MAEAILHHSLGPMVLGCLRQAMPKVRIPQGLTLPPLLPQAH